MKIECDGIYNNGCRARIGDHDPAYSGPEGQFWCGRCYQSYLGIVKNKDFITTNLGELVLDQFNLYQREAIKSCTYKEGGHYPTYMALASLTEEIGEVAQLLRKANRDNKELDLEKLKEELGDVLWGVAMMANLHGISLKDVALGNLTKQLNRHPDAYAK